MYYNVVGDQTHIFAEEGEDDGSLLRAIVRSSFESAPLNPHWLLASVARLSEPEVDSFILSAPRFYDDVVVEMNNVHGRFCRTVLYKVGSGHFVLFDKYYRPHRGDPKPMLDTA